MSPTCFEPEDASSGRWFYIYRYVIMCLHASIYVRSQIIRRVCSIVHHTCIYKRLPEEEPPSPKHLEDTKKLKIKILFLKSAVLWFIFCNYITMHGAKT